MSLSSEQQEVIDLALAGHNVCVDSPAGTGKTYTIQALCQTLDERGLPYLKTGTTGAAAVRIDGTTIHSMLGLRLCLGPIEHLEDQLGKMDTTKLENAKYLIVDEMSMWEPLFFAKVSHLFQFVRSNVELPFGGIKLVFFGDFFQLPPVIKGYSDAVLEQLEGYRELEEAPNCHFIFQHSLWEQANFRHVNFTTSYRHLFDPAFDACLLRLRKGILENQDIELLQTRVIPDDEEVVFNGVKPTRLRSLNADVERINCTELAALPGVSQMYEGICNFNTRDRKLRTAFEQWVTHDSKINPCLQFKVGAQVMVTWNLDLESGWCNGTRGVVTRLSDHSVTVQRRDGATKVIGNVVFERGTKHGTIRYEQLPLMLAFALSIHKSQGSTLDCVEMSMDGIFADGQAYVAFGRARSLDSLCIRDFDPEKIVANKYVLEYYESKGL